MMLSVVWGCFSGKQSLGERSHLRRALAGSQHRYLLGCARFKQLEFWKLVKTAERDAKLSLACN